MSVKVSSWCWDNGAGSTTQRLVLLALADEANDEGLVCAYRRSRTYLAEKCRVSPQAVKRAVRGLVELGLLEVLEPGTGRQQSNYRILMEAVSVTPQGGRGRALRGVASDPPIIPFLSRSYPGNPRASGAEGVVAGGS